jgi:hypothetical protein
MMNAQDERYSPLGTHLIRVDGDTVFVIARGQLKADEMRVLLETYDRIAVEQGRLFILYDGRECTGVDPDARKLAAEERITRKEADLQIAFGLSFAVRIILNMLIRAQAVLRNRQVSVRVFDTEAEALAFLVPEREKIRQEKDVNQSL